MRAIKGANLARVGVLLGLCLGLAACPRPIKAPPPAPGLPPVPEADVRGATVYEIDPQASELNIFVYRGGSLARLGHNHVMSSKSLTGRVWMRPRLAASGFELSFPVNELIVDDPDVRRAAGEDFPPEIPAADKEGTRKNMLRAEVLDAEHYPRVEVRSVQVSGALPAPEVVARMTIKSSRRDITTPVTLAITGDRLTANGEFDILQTDFGIKPFSIGLGALEVQDRLRVRYKLVAVKR